MKCSAVGEVFFSFSVFSLFAGPSNPFSSFIRLFNVKKNTLTADKMIDQIIDSMFALYLTHD